MPNITGGLAQYTLACMGPLPTIISMVGGYLLCNILSAGVEASIFAYAMSSVIPLPIPSIVYTAIMMVFIMVANLYGVDMFAKVQDFFAGVADQCFAVQHWCSGCRYRRGGISVVYAD